MLTITFDQYERDSAGGHSNRKVSFKHTPGSSRKRRSEEEACADSDEDESGLLGAAAAAAVAAMPGPLGTIWKSKIPDREVAVAQWQNYADNNREVHLRQYASITSVITAIIAYGG